MISSISFIGSGNVATQFANAFHEKGISINQILSKNISNAEKLASQVTAAAISSFSNLDLSVDLIIIAVNDDAIEEVAKQIETSSVVIHMSGASSLSKLESCGENTGLVWPIKSIKKDQTVDFSSVSCCVESSNENVKEQLFTLFGLVSNKVVYLDEKQREYLHLAAVLSNNFTNYLYTISKEILDENEIDFSILTGLISQSVKQIEDVSPEKSQTGPAMRNERKVIEKHLKLLENKPEYYNLYKFVSDSIIKKYHE